MISQQCNDYRIRAMTFHDPLSRRGAVSLVPYHQRKLGYDHVQPSFACANGASDKMDDLEAWAIEWRRGRLVWRCRAPREGGVDLWTPRRLWQGSVFCRQIPSTTVAKRHCAGLKRALASSNGDVLSSAWE